jgi:excisionase family DNA binding protein
MLPYPPLTLPTDEDVQLAQTALEVLAGHAGDLTLNVGDKTLTVSASITNLLERLFEAMAQGKAVGILSLEPELSLPKAATLLDLSIPALLELLEAGDFPFHTVGGQQRIRLGDVFAYLEVQALREGYEAMSEDYEQNPDPLVDAGSSDGLEPSDEKTW